MADRKSEQKMIKKTAAFLLIAFLLIFIYGCNSGGARPDGNTREITDLTGRKLYIPVDPQRIAAMTGPSYEMVFMLGGKDRVALVKGGHTVNFPLALLTNPDLANYASVGANPSSSVNIEDYMRRDVDMVIYYDNGAELKKFAAAGIPAVILTLETGLKETIEETMAQSIGEYIELSTAAAGILADILGEEALKKYAAWKKYCAEKLTMIYERTKDLPDEKRKTIFWGNTWGENILSSYSLKNRYYEIRLCGGTLLGPLTGTGNFPEVTAEQLFAWNPEIIAVDNHGNFPDLVIADMYKENSRWASLQAVKNRQLYRIPAGVFFLDKGTTTTLMLLWLANILQPELFPDINMVEEIKYYYREFYSYDLNDDEALKVLNGWHEWSGENSW
ncbi:MAG: ABC transporter substrate-binding protein [Treponema sp.]|nr:ABC transporter substrate-binding protein [Treponema sp.]